MSDYPRPVPPPLTKPYGPDWVVAALIGVLALYSLGQSVFYVFRHPLSPSSPPAIYFLSVYGLSVAICAWVLGGLARSRFWVLMTSLILCAMGFAGHLLRVGTPWTATAVVEVVAIFYAAARLFGFLGPRPIRRQDLYGRS